MKAEDCLFTINTNKPVDHPDRKINYYTLLGYHDFIDDQNKPRLKTDAKNVFAKSIFDNELSRFYIKVGTYGRIFNPIGLFSEGKADKFSSKIGKKEFEFKEVNKQIFDLYLNFLSTKNIAWLNNAEREMM